MLYFYMKVWPQGLPSKVCPLKVPHFCSALHRMSLEVSAIGLDRRKIGTYDVHMIDLEFKWDDRKNKANTKKHGVSFEEARTIFFDEKATAFFDPDHSEDEDRFILLGISIRLRILVVCHCFRESETVVWIISARKADKVEAQDYWRRRS